MSCAALAPRGATAPARAFMVFLVLAVFGLMAADRSNGLSAGGADEPASLSAELKLIPPGALGFVQVRVRDLLETTAGKKIRQQFAKEIAQAEPEIVKQLGVRIDDVDRIVLLVMSEKENRPLAVVTTTRPFDREKVLKAVFAEYRDNQIKGQSYYTSAKEGRTALRFINDRSYVSGMVEDVVQQIVKPARAEGAHPLQRALALATEKHLVAAGVNIPVSATEAAKEQIDRRGDTGRLEAIFEKAFRPMLEVRNIAVVVDIDREAELRVELQFPDAKAATDALWTARDGLAVGRLVLNASVDGFAKQAEFAKVLPLLRQVQLALRNVTVEQNDKAIQGVVRLPADPAAVAAMLPAIAEATVQARQGAERAQSTNNLKQIALAMHNYHDTYQGFPAQAIYSKDGKPLLSWRVSILPYIEQDNVYKQFKLDEPWDSAHNKKLLQQMPAVYASPRDAQQMSSLKLGGKRAPVTHTYYQVFFGKSAGFEGKRGLQISSFVDGTSNTLLVAEAGNPVPWTKPDDLEYDANKPLPKLGGIFPNGFYAAFADGSVRFIAKTVEETTLRGVITRNGGEVVNLNEAQ